MGLNVSAASGSGFYSESQGNSKNTTKYPQTKSEISNTANNIAEAIFNSVDQEIRELYCNPQLAMLKASYQMNLNSSLKETLKYLKTHANQKSEKKAILGEIWKLYSSSEENYDENEWMDLVIDSNAKNIFAA